MDAPIVVRRVILLDIVAYQRSVLKEIWPPTQRRKRKKHTSVKTSGMLKLGFLKKLKKKN